MIDAEKFSKMLENKDFTNIGNGFHKTLICGLEQIQPYSKNHSYPHHKGLNTRIIAFKKMRIMELKNKAPEYKSQSIQNP